MVLSDASRLPGYAALPTLICRFPGTIVGTVVALSLLALLEIVNPRTGEFQIRVDPSEQALLGPNHEGWEFYQFAPDAPSPHSIEPGTDDALAMGMMDPVVARRRGEQGAGVVAVRNHILVG